MAPRTLKELAQEALAVQNACNPLGLTRGFADATLELRDRLVLDNLPSDTRSICLHPVYRMWASKMHDLAGMGMSDFDKFGEACATCETLANS